MRTSAQWALMLHQRMLGRHPCAVPNKPGKRRQYAFKQSRPCSCAGGSSAGGSYAAVLQCGKTHHHSPIPQQQYLLPTIPIVYTACMLTTHESPSARLQHSKQSWLGPAGFCCLLQAATAGNSYSGAHHLKECMVHWRLHDVIHRTPHATNCKQAMVHGHFWKGLL